MIELRVRNMVCRHCVEALEGVLSRLGLEAESVTLGGAVLKADSLPEDVLVALDRELQEQGFSRVSNPEELLVERVKLAVLHHVRDEQECRLKLSACVEEYIGQSYEAASRIFSQRQGRTIEKYAIALRVEWVKELLAAGYERLSDVAWRTGYSSVAHLSRQFKAVTGLTPTQYMASGYPRRSLGEV